MAVLFEGPNQYTVRILRRPQDTEFTEFVKIGKREKLDATECERYIVCEPGQAYSVEVTIEKGFRWGAFDEIEIELTFAGTDDCVAGVYIGKGEFDTEDAYTIHLDCVNFDELGETVGAPFTFKKVAVGMSSA